VCRVIIIENYVSLRTTLAELLSSWGYEVETAADGLEAVGKIPKFDPAVVVSGLQMPRLGGMELLKALRHRFPKISCIVISGDASAEKATEAIRLGAFSFLEKPVEAERLHTDLRKCLEHTSSGSAPEGSWTSQHDIVSGLEVVPHTH
jgi:DNA-binding NtrC family response regulator